ncbi:MAG: tetratricopeptide repeat protein [Gallionella sp.]|nr:tetratricopeptide repeat protein [Gallionella sp.]
MRYACAILVGLPLLLASCATEPISRLQGTKIDLKDEKVEGGLDKAIRTYQLFLEKFPESDKSPEVIRRLANLKLNKEVDAPKGDAAPENVATLARGKTGSPEMLGKVKQPAPAVVGGAASEKPHRPGTSDKEDIREAIKDFEQRTTTAEKAKPSPPALPLPGKAGASPVPAGTQDAIALYKKLLSDYPDYESNDQVLYQLARAYDEQGNADEAMKMMVRLVREYPNSEVLEEIQFRMGEYYFARKQYAEARNTYKALIASMVYIGPGSYYESALYKLGWTYYKQELYEDAVKQFVSLLDYKIDQGLNLERSKDLFEEKRIEDTFRVLSLSFSNLGGGEAIDNFFKQNGMRSYTPRVYKHLGEYYVDVHRYTDAAAIFKGFSKNNTCHNMSPKFDMLAIDSFKKGGFTIPVIEAKKEFIHNYGSKSACSKRFDAATLNELSVYVNSSLKELASYYHGRFQDKRLAEKKDENFQEAVRWYREYLGTFPKDKGALAIHYLLAELLHENKLYVEAATEYEHIAYDYPVHEKSATAGYAAIYAHRERLADAGQDERDRVMQDIIRSSLKFAETFPKNEKAVLVMSATVDDIYGMKDYSQAAAAARKLMDKYPRAEPTVRRAAWLIFAHSSFELGKFKEAEDGYVSALALTAANDKSRRGLIDNLAAAIYKQGEQASKQGDYKLASSLFLSVGIKAPSASIRPVADFDAAAAMMQLKAWDTAANILLALRANYPGHKLQPEVTKTLAFMHKEAGKLSLAAAEYEQLGIQAGDNAVRRDALELAAGQYIQANEMDKAIQVYRRYVSDFTRPLEPALEMRYKIAMHLKMRNDMEGYLGELKQILDADARAGSERTDRTRYLGAMAAQAHAEQTINQLYEIKLAKPFAKNLLKKQNAMKAAKEQLEKLFDYEVIEVTSAATYYLAEMYYDFSRALVESERPTDLGELEKEQYELSIEEQAYPFEEKTIEVHQVNLGLMARSIYNPWIEKSIGRLAKLVPARYAKFEESSGYIAEFDTVSYAALVEPKRVALTPAPAADAVPPAAEPAPAKVESGQDEKKGQ